MSWIVLAAYKKNSCCRGAQRWPTQGVVSWAWGYRVRGEYTTLENSCPFFSTPNKATYSSTIGKEGFSLGSVPVEVVGSLLGTRCCMKSICICQMLVKHNEITDMKDSWKLLLNEAVPESQLISDSCSRVYIYWEALDHRARGIFLPLVPHSCLCGWLHICLLCVVCLLYRTIILF